MDSPTRAFAAKCMTASGREVLGRRHDGSRFPMECAVSEMVVNGQRGFTVSVRDVSERHRAEAQMRMASLIFQSSPEAMLVIDLDNNILSVNPALTRITGYDIEDIRRGGQLRQLRSHRHGDDFYQRLRSMPPQELAKIDMTRLDISA